MQLENPTEVMSATAREIFETMFFLAPEDMPAPEDWNAPAAAAAVHFSGARVGRFEIALEHPLARELAAGFCGLADPDEMAPEQVPQILCELANMVCGATLSRMEPGALFNLDTPRLSEPDETRDHAPQMVQWLDSGQGLIRLAMQWN